MARENILRFLVLYIANTGAMGFSVASLIQNPIGYFSHYSHPVVTALLLLIQVFVFVLFALPWTGPVCDLLEFIARHILRTVRGTRRWRLLGRRIDARLHYFEAEIRQINDIQFLKIRRFVNELGAIFQAHS